MAGHPKNFPTPEDLESVIKLWKASLITQANKWKKPQYVGKDGHRVEDEIKIPMIFEGFKRFCYENGYGTVEQYFTNQDGLYDKYIGVCHALKNEIREDLIIGGLLGFYNTSITQRVTDLTDKTENKNTNTHSGNIDITMDLT